MARDAEATKERILTAAFEEFTDHGFAGARVDEIAARAGCNKALLYQHYGDKEALFKHVLECKMAELPGVSDDPESLGELAGAYFDFHAQNPWFIRLMQWEALNLAEGHIPNEKERREHLQEHVAEFERAQIAGTVDPSLDPKQTILTLIGIVSVWFSAPQSVRMLLGKDTHDARALTERRAHIMAMARRILEVK